MQSLTGGEGPTLSDRKSRYLQDRSLFSQGAPPFVSVSGTGTIPLHGPQVTVLGQTGIARAPVTANEAPACLTPTQAYTVTR